MKDEVNDLIEYLKKKDKSNMMNFYVEFILLGILIVLAISLVLYLILSNR